MIRKKKTFAFIGSTLGIVGGLMAFPAAANAAETVCEPGYVDTSFTQSASGFEAAGSTAGSNGTDTTREITLQVQHESTHSASVTGSISLDSVLSPVKAQLAATATASESWTAGASIPVTLAPGETATVVYGYSTVTFSGSQRTCTGAGQFGPSTSFSGQAPTGTQFNL
ncbi:hypothetical protein [Cryobacterium sp. SO1]|uniref:hypothetical protein n=1 Tax=Cryobacterium sp. SO1 TaxID=1897061 RepID=UPI001022CA80|nr:hypothetical protein [Cryobacterium sp. SO1]